MFFPVCGIVHRLVLHCIKKSTTLDKYSVHKDILLQFKASIENKLQAHCFSPGEPMKWL